MRQIISNPVLTCENVFELTILESILQSKKYHYQKFEEGLQIEIYESLKIVEWSSLCLFVDEVCDRIRNTIKKNNDLPDLYN